MPMQKAERSEPKAARSGAATNIVLEDDLNPPPGNAQSQPLSQFARLSRYNYIFFNSRYLVKKNEYIYCNLFCYCTYHN